MKRTQAMMMGLALAGVMLPPLTAEAATPSAEKKKEQRYLKQLKRLPNGATAPAKVKTLALRLVKLAPQRGQRFYKIAVLKYSVVFVERKATFLMKKFHTQIDRSDLAASRKRQIKRQITKIERRVIQYNEPTPTPYQARIEQTEFFA